MSPRPTDPPRISCVMPAYNEARNLPSFVPTVLDMLASLSPDFELILVDDGSRDNTVEVAQGLCAQHPQVVLLKLSRNFGKESALSAGLAAARGDVVILMDSDGQHPTSLLPTLLQYWRQGAEVVYAVRRTRHDQSGLQATLTDWFYKIVNIGNRVPIPAHAGDFRLMDRKVVDALNALPERNRFMKGLYAWVGFQSVAVDYEPLPRLQGQSNFGWRGSFALAFTGMLAFSIAPLRLLTLMGLMLALGAMGYGCWVVLVYFLWGIAVPGYATIVTGMMFLSGIQLLSIGVLSEYVGRIYEEVKQRPLFLVSARFGSGLTLAPAPPPSHPTRLQE